MSEESKTTVFTVRVDDEQLKKSMVETQKQINATKKAQEDLNAEIKKSGTVTETQIQQQLDLKAKLKDLNGQQAANTKGLELHNKIQQAAKGSIEQMRAELSVLTKQWNELSEEERENSKVGKQLEKEARKLSDALKEQEGKIGDNRRSVGGYKQAIMEAIKGNSGFGKSIDATSVAFKANPIGFFIGLIISLIGTLQKLQPVMNFVERATAAVNAAIDVLTGRLAKVIEAVKNAENPLTIIKNLFGGLGDEIAKAVVDTNDIVQALQDIGDAERALSVSVAQTNKEVQELLIKAKNRTLSEKERLDLLNQAAQKERDIHQEQLRLAKEREAALEKRNARLAKERTLTDDHEQELADAQIARINLEMESGNLQERIAVRRDQLLQDEITKRQKAFDDRVKQMEKLNAEAQKAEERRLADEKAALELSVLQTEEGTERRLEAVIRLAKLERDIALTNKELTENQKLLIQARFDELELKARKEHALKLLEEKKKAWDKEAAERKAVAEKALADAQALVNANVAERQREADEKAAIRQAEYEAAASIADAMGSLTSIIAGQSAEAAEFQKAITLFTIAISTAEAISKGIASSQSLPFPGNMVAMASTIATVLANVAQAKALVMGAGVPKAPQFRYGTIAEGPTHEQGGIGMYVNGRKIGEMEGNEPILTAGVTRDKRLLAAASALNVAAGGRALIPRSHMAVGGISPSALKAPAFRPSGGDFINYDKLAAAMAKQPAPINRWQDFQKVADQQAKVTKFVNQ